MAVKRCFWRPNLRNYCEKIRWLWLTAKPKKLLEKDKMVIIASYCKPKKWECGCLVRDRIMAQRHSFVSKLCPLNFWMVQSVACLRFFGRAHPPRVVKPLYLPAEVRPELRGRRWRSGGRRQQLKGPAWCIERFLNVVFTLPRREFVHDLKIKTWMPYLKSATSTSKVCQMTQNYWVIYEKRKINMERTMNVVFEANNFHIKRVSNDRKIPGYLRKS